MNPLKHISNLGSASFVTDATGYVDQHIQYLPFGELFISQRNSTFDSRYKFTAKELDNETQYTYFGARYLDSEISIWLSVDPLSDKYPSISPYIYVDNKPIVAIDPDGKDIVFINKAGKEVYRVKSDMYFKTFIQCPKSVSPIGWTEVPMPKIIQQRTQTKENTTGASYQNNDYLIAARVGYFNQAKNNGLLEVYTEGGDLIPINVVKQIPDLDPTLIKAITIQESHAGITGVSDVMQVNVPGDWSVLKSKYGLRRNEATDVSTSLYAGIRFLTTKGFKGGVSYNSSNGEKTYNFQGWQSAVSNYNGGGTNNYVRYVYKMVNSATEPSPANY